MRKWFRFVCFSLLATVVLVEAGDRLYLAWLAPERVLLEYGTLEQIRARGFEDRYTPHRMLGYIPTPNWSRGKDRHNGLGFRGPEIAVEKPPGVLRIACLGGSTTYGNKVEDPADSYPAALEAELRRRGRKVEVVNAGVPGWSSLQSLVGFEARVLPLDPDVVVVYHGVNDVHPRLVWPPSAYRRDQSGHIAPPLPNCQWWEWSSALRTVSVYAGYSQPFASISRTLGSPPYTAWSLEFWRQVRDGVYPSGFFRDTPAAEMLMANPPIHMETNLRDIAALSMAHNARVVLATWALSVPALTGDDPRLATPEYQGAVAEQNVMIRRLAGELGVTLWDLEAADILPEDYVDGYHFNAAGNRRRAWLLADLMESKLEGEL